MKEKWEKPKLIVIVRTTPEESVLIACKGGVPGTPATTDFNCFDLSCTPCSAVLMS